jgi:uncharacterized protein (TIGR02569 family)
MTCDPRGARSDPPPPWVVTAFGLRGAPAPLAGGQGRSWRVGRAVLKPVDVVAAELDWQAELFGRISGDGFRIARPILARGGATSAGGWHAQEMLPGRHMHRWADIVEVGMRFHAALSGEPRPSFLDERLDPWAIGDRVAWEELPAGDHARSPHVSLLLRARRPVDAPSQLIHGDLGGNVLFDDPQPPAIIDFSPYWRPPAFASAIVVADALVWEGADDSILATLSGVDAGAQFLVRALIYRSVTARRFHEMGRSPTDDADRFAPVVDLAVRLATG